MSMIKYLNNQNFEVDLSQIPIIDNTEKQNLCYMVYKNHRYYWNSCEFIYKKHGKSNIDHWNDLRFLDLKVTSSMFYDKKSYECVKKFLTNDQHEKVLHIVNTANDKKSLFEFEEWNIICEIINEFSSNYLTVEIINKVFWKNNYLQDLEYEINRCREIWNCHRLEFFRYFDTSNFYHIPLISPGIVLPKQPKQKYKKYKDIYET